MRLSQPVPEEIGSAPQTCTGYLGFADRWLGSLPCALLKLGRPGGFAPTATAFTGPDADYYTTVSIDEKVAEAGGDAPHPVIAERSAFEAVPARSSGSASVAEMATRPGLAPGLPV